MTLVSQDITVVGGGVAGLAAARAVALRGAHVRLFEQAPVLSGVGAGLQVSPNGMRVIDALGLGQTLRATSIRAQAIELRDGFTGDHVLRLDLAKATGDYLFVHRSKLIDVLESGARDAGVEIELGERIAPGDSARLTFAADGVRSSHRTRLNDDPSALFTGQVAWRAVVPDTGAAPEAQVYMGPGRHLVSYPLARGLRNIVAVEERTAWADEGWYQEDDPEAVQWAFKDFADPVPEWLGRIETVFLWGLFRHPVARRWHGDGMVLLGDAAHPTLPFLAQGANMALEDAWVLADRLDRLGVAQGLPAYQTARRERVRRVIEAANRNARNYHLAGPARFAAHALLRIGNRLAPGAALRRFDWLYDHDVLDNS